MEGFWTIKVSDVINSLILIATIGAIIWGPIKALEISRASEEKRDANRRKREIFAVLMRTRSVRMNPDHVGALNLIQVEFFGNQKVIDAYRRYIAHLNEPQPAPPALDNFFQVRTDLFYDLLHEISASVDLSMDRRELDRLAYSPSGWWTDEDQIRTFRRGIIEILEGRKPLHVAPFAHAPANPFPPPPAAQQ